MSVRKSRAWRKRAGCSGKLRYSTAKQAQFEIDRAKEYRGVTLYLYPCGDHFHLTSMNPAERQRYVID